MKNETFSVTQYGEYNMDYKTKEWEQEYYTEELPE